MPVFKKIVGGNFKIAIWQLEEDLSYFESRFTAPVDITHANKKLQWYASRHLANEMLGVHTEIEKDEAGKPVLKHTNKHISLSHTPQFAAAMLGEKYPVGIDLEMINPKVERIAHKFLRADEVEAIDAHEKIEKLILYWSAKEALYKLYGKGGIEFSTQLLIEPFTLKNQGILNARITGIPDPIENLVLHYEFFNDHVLTYVVHTN